MTALKYSSTVIGAEQCSFKANNLVNCTESSFKSTPLKFDA